MRNGLPKLDAGVEQESTRIFADPACRPVGITSRHFPVSPGEGVGCGSGAGEGDHALDVAGLGEEVDGLDPLEPPPQGDMPLKEIREQVGDQMVLFGNIEASEIEQLAPPAFEARVRQAIADGTEGAGRGFVLMPSACPYGREIPAHVLTNYETMVRLVRE